MGEATTAEDDGGGGSRSSIPAVANEAALAFLKPSDGGVRPGSRVVFFHRDDGVRETGRRRVRVGGRRGRTHGPRHPRSIISEATRTWRRLTDNQSRHQRKQENKDSCDRPHGRRLSGVDTKPSKTSEPECETTNVVAQTFPLSNVSLLWKRSFDPRGKKKKKGWSDSKTRKRKKKLPLALKLML